jgi:septum formation protein
MEEVILASGSPRRRELLALLGLQFCVVAADVDESAIVGEAPSALARRLSREKAFAVARGAGDAVVIAADTIVVIDGAILGKPATPAQARQMLRTLHGQPHQVLSAITVIRGARNETITDLAETIVRMREYTDDEISRYVASGDPMDKAGAYAIQSAAFSPVEGIDGCYASVMGLPLCHVYRALRRLGVSDVECPVAGCRVVTGYPCTYYTAALGEPAAGIESADPSASPNSARC